MTDRDNRDEPAFPGLRETTEIGGPLCTAPGLTKREAAAIAAMQGLLASGPHDCDEHGIAHDARLHADALLAELAKREAGEGGNAR